MARSLAAFLCFLLVSSSCAKAPLPKRPLVRGLKPAEVKNSSANEEKAGASATPVSAAPAEDLRLITYSVDTLPGSDDCPGLRSVDRQENEFSIGFDGLNDTIDSESTDKKRVDFCKLKGTAIVPPGYIVELEAAERIGKADFLLGEKTAVDVKMGLESRIGGNAFYQSYIGGHIGPLDLFEVGFVLDKVNDDNNFFDDIIAPVTCKDASEKIQEMTFTIDYALQWEPLPEEGASDEFFSGELNLYTLPSVALKLKRCDAPEPEPESELAPTLSFQVNEEQSKPGCTVLTELGRTADTINAKIDPLSIVLQPGQEIADRICFLRGLITVPAKHFIQYEVLDGVNVTGRFDDQTRLVVTYTVHEEIQGKDIVASRHDIEDVRGQTQDTVYLFPGSEDLKADKCRNVSDVSATASLSVDLFAALVPDSDAVRGTQTASITNFPTLKMKLVKCP